jgi:hypothetical protein
LKAAALFTNYDNRNMIAPAERHTIEQIEGYVLGKLSRKQVDELWIKFLKNPEYLKYLEIELYLRRSAFK